MDNEPYDLKLGNFRLDGRRNLLSWLGGFTRNTGQTRLDLKGNLCRISYSSRVAYSIIFCKHNSCTRISEYNVIKCIGIYKLKKELKT
jgi:hypothetical protein